MASYSCFQALDSASDKHIPLCDLTQLLTKLNRGIGQQVGQRENERLK